MEILIFFSHYHNLYYEQIFLGHNDIAELRVDSVPLRDSVIYTDQQSSLRDKAIDAAAENNSNNSDYSEVKSDCPACRVGDIPTVHKCIYCFKAVHAFDMCSVPAPGSEEGYGQKRICHKCHSSQQNKPPSLTSAPTGKNLQNAHCRSRLPDTADRAKSNCRTCQAGHVPILYRCVVCLKPVHAINGCSIPFPGATNKWICYECNRVPHLPSAPSPKSVDYVDFSKRRNVGLKNIGNTCYLNSVVQCLSGTKKLAEFFLCSTQDSNLLKKINNRESVAAEMAVLIKKLWNTNSTSISPRTLKKVVGNVNNLFKNKEQQDAHDFLLFLLDQIHEELKIEKVC